MVIISKKYQFAQINLQNNYFDGHLQIPQDGVRRITLEKILKFITFLSCEPPQK